VAAGCDIIHLRPIAIPKPVPEALDPRGDAHETPAEEDESVLFDRMDRRARRVIRRAKEATYQCMRLSTRCSGESDGGRFVVADTGRNSDAKIRGRHIEIPMAEN
jgi:hypothetical protein